MMDYYAIQKEDYIAHYGVKGMKWGVRRTPEQLGHATVARINTLRSKIQKAKETHNSNVVSRNKRKTARINSKNDILRAKTERAELKAREREAKARGRKQKNSSGGSNGNAVSKGISQGVQQGTSKLVAQAIGAAASRHYSNILADPNTSNGKKLFAMYMGGKTEAGARNEWDLERAVSKGKHYNTSVEDLQMAYEKANSVGKKKKKDKGNGD